ncbi:MAG: outer membrane protein transport protein [Mariprofundaceae bacterium]|nr:outer membrane protein transport protein [Mariprofundaceae bacterium]
MISPRYWFYALCLRDQGGKNMQSMTIKNLLRYGFVFCAAFVFSAQSALAGGFQIGEMATRASGMGSAFTAVADDASAAWHNPAGVAFSSANQAMLGGDALLIPGSKFTSNASTKGVGGAPITAAVDAKRKNFFVPHAYYTYMDKRSGLGAAVSINAPFGLETNWPETSPFKTKSTFSRIQMLMINPSIVYKINDNISVAAGVDYAFVNNVDLNSTLQNMNGNGDGWGANAAIFYKSDSFDVGITYRSRIKVDITGSALAKSTLATLGASTSSANTSLTLPDQVNVGLAFRPSPAWLLSFDVDWVNWKTYDAINITFDNAAYRTAVRRLQTRVGATVTGQTNLLENWKATTAFRAGAEWTYSPTMRARFGYVFDPTPINDVDFTPSIPGNDRQIFSVGYGYDINPKMTVDLLYAYVYFSKRDQTASSATPAGSPNTVKNGVYKSDVHILALSLNYKF